MSSFLIRTARMRITPVSLNQLYAFGGKASGSALVRLQNAQFLHSELKVRIAQRVVELQELPFGLSKTSHIKNVISWLEEYFELLAAQPYPTSENDEHEFSELLQFILQDNSEVIETTSRGVLEVRNRKQGFSTSEQREVDRSLNRFYLSRIGLRFLIEHHLAASRNHPGFAGIIETECKPVDYIALAAQDTRSLCEYHLGEAPEYHWKEIGVPKGMDNISLTYVPGHLMYMLQEVLKNASRATVEQHLDSPGGIPPIQITVVNGVHDVTIRISDEGGGIKRENLKKIWSYLHSTASDPGFSSDSGGGRPPAALAGYGVGLPLSRVYARYFGGDLDIKSLEGYGTDAYLHVSRLGDKCENLPEVVLRSPAESDSTLARGQSGMFFFDNNVWEKRGAEQVS